MYSLTYVQCLVLKLHKIMAESSFQIHTRDQNLKIAPILIKHTSNLVIRIKTEIGEK